MHRVDQRGGNAGILAGNACRGGVDGLGENQAEAQAQHEQARQHIADIAGGHGDLGQEDQTAGTQQHAGRDQGARSKAYVAGQVRADQDAADHRQEQQPRRQRAVSLDHLQVERQEQEGAEERHSGDADSDIGAAAGAVNDHPQRQQRVTDTPLSDDEPGEQHHAADQGAEGQCVRPPGGQGIGEAEHDRERPGASQHGADPVHSRPTGRSAAADVDQGANDGDRGEHQVHIHAPAP